MKKNIQSLLWVFACLHVSFSFAGQSPKLQSYVDYIQKYAPIAVVKMQEHKIPASITLAQGILESGAGQSELAKKSNNHFGIKCHDDWTGDKVYHDDDKKHECFRKYKSVELSYEDHSQFLMKNRYKKLFELETTDYKGWAKGLKECGYATAPDYAKKLINLIETYELYKYDTGEASIVQTDTNDSTLTPEEKRVHSMGSITPYRYHKVSGRGKSRSVIAMAGDTYESIAKEFHLQKWQIRRYNHIKKGDTKQPAEGEVVIIGR
ncbi:MAG: glucosaminidase domain-containing protein [Paludibacteraceae bacterium]|nr:glucosaminidase domain-containing protein [Paludibacteraceae bacterium]